MILNLKKRLFVTRKEGQRTNGPYAHYGSPMSSTAVSDGDWSTLATGSIALLMLLGLSLSFGKRFADSMVSTSPSTVSIFPNWLAGWLAISSAICVWDAMFVLNREGKWINSFEHVVWSPYKDYVKVDRLYGKIEDDFVFCQSLMNLAEVALNVVALILVSKKCHRQAAVVALVVCTMTCSKTILYHLMEWSCGGCNTVRPLRVVAIAPDPTHERSTFSQEQNDWTTFLTLYALPNGMWIWVPLYACVTLGARLASSPEKMPMKQTATTKAKKRTPRAKTPERTPKRSHRMRTRSSRKR